MNDKKEAKNRKRLDSESEMMSIDTHEPVGRQKESGRNRPRATLESMAWEYFVP